MSERSSATRSTCSFFLVFHCLSRLSSIASLSTTGARYLRMSHPPSCPHSLLLFLFYLHSTLSRSRAIHVRPHAFPYIFLFIRCNDDPYTLSLTTPHLPYYRFRLLIRDDPLYPSCVFFRGCIITIIFVSIDQCVSSLLFSPLVCALVISSLPALALVEPLSTTYPPLGLSSLVPSLCDPQIFLVLDDNPPSQPLP